MPPRHIQIYTLPGKCFIIWYMLIASSGHFWKALMLAGIGGSAGTSLTFLALWAQKQISANKLSTGGLPHTFPQTAQINENLDMLAWNLGEVETSSRVSSSIGCSSSGGGWLGGRSGGGVVGKSAFGGPSRNKAAWIAAALPTLVSIATTRIQDEFRIIDIRAEWHVEMSCFLLTKPFYRKLHTHTHIYVYLSILCICICTSKIVKFDTCGIGRMPSVARKLCGGVRPIAFHPEIFQHRSTKRWIN